MTLTLTKKQLQDNTLEVLKARYFLKDENGNPVEDFEGMCKRVADFVATGELKSLTFDSDATSQRELEAVGKKNEFARKFYEMMVSQAFMPNSPTLFNAGREQPMLSACFILPVPNSIGEIFDSIRNGAVIFKYGGGIGMDFSQLQPAGSRTTRGGVASGSLSFMEPFQAMSDTIQQGGTRRGAMMAMLQVDHPEILNFIDCKLKTPTERIRYLVKNFGLKEEAAKKLLTELDWKAPFRGFNISVKLTTEFMQAVQSDGVYRLKNPDGSSYRGPVLDPRGELLNFGPETGIKSLPAKEVWRRIVEGAWKSAEPGICFIDRINDDNPVKSLGTIHNSNPCGEYFQVDFNSCNLGSINLAKFFLSDIDAFVRRGHFKPGEKLAWFDHIDWVGLAEVTRVATRFLDHVITLNEYPIPEIAEVSRASRPTGLGVMGFADLLLLLEVRYGSHESVQIAQQLMQWIQYWAWMESVYLAKDFGPFPELEANRNYFVDKLDCLTNLFHDQFNHEHFPAFSYLQEFDTGLYEEFSKHGVRNCHVTVIAPTGTISLIAECSSGIEPVFAFHHKRQDSIGIRWYSHPLLQSWQEKNPGLNRPEFFVEANDVTPDEHVLIQSAFQKHCDNAVSKTCNMPSSTTIEDVDRIYRRAYALGLKGITVYIDGSREGVLMKEAKVSASADKVEKSPIDDNAGSTRSTTEPTVSKGVVEKRPEFLPGGTFKIRTANKGNVYVTVNWDPERRRIFEVFIRENAGNEHVELNGRFISQLLRVGIPLDQVLKPLWRTRGELAIWLDGQCFSSIAQAIAYTIDKANKYFSTSFGETTFEPEKEAPPESIPVEIPEVDVAEPRFEYCPNCNRRAAVPAGGCLQCTVCGYSTCGGTTK